MGDPQTTGWQEFLNQSAEFLMKALGWVISISLGVVAKIAFEANRRVLKKKEILAIVAISFFVGYLVATWCEYKKWDEAAKFLVPLGTLLGQSLVNHLMTNWKAIIEKLFNVFIKNGNGHKKEEKND